MKSIKEIYSLFSQSTGVCTDTRKVNPGQLYVALSGPNFNGNKFAKEALAAGALAAIVDDSSYVDENIHLVESSLNTLQNLANYHRRQLGIPIIALTGSNGKTTTKELMAAVLMKKFKIHFTKGNLNNHIGVPLTLLEMSEEHELAIIEMGANHQGEIANLCEIAEPNFGLITNIGLAHLEGFGGPEGVRKGKTEMYDFLQHKSSVIFFNEYELSLNTSRPASSQLVPYGISNISVETISTNKEGRLFAEVRIDDILEKVQSNFFGEYNINNILTAFAVGKYFKVDSKEMVNAVENYFPDNNRSEIIKTAKDNTLILDAYNANPTSIKNALKQLSNVGCDRFFVIGAMKELGDYSIIEHQNIINYAKELSLNGVFIGDEFSSLNSQEYTCYDSVDSYIQDFTPISHTTILIKGSRSMQLEKLENMF